MKFEFLAKSIKSYIEDDVCVVSFADSNSDDPSKYLILSQTLFDSGDDDNEISIEYGKNGDSATGGVKMAQLRTDSFVLNMDPKILRTSSFNVMLAEPLTDAVKEHLKIILAKSGVKLTV